jgi:cytochrome c-type biogenesis protein
MNVSGVIAFLSGILSFFSPCVLPIVPSYLFFISGISFDNYSETEFRKYRKIVIVHAISFIVGFSLVFISLGLTSSLLGKFFSTYQTYIMRIGGFVLIVMGLHFMGLIRIPFLDQERAFSLKEKPLGLFGSLVVGATFSLGWTPCVGPVLSSILIIAGTSGEATEGAYLLSLYSLGLGLPFFASALLFHKLFQVLQKFRAVTRYTTKVLGAFLIGIGLLLFTNYYSVLSRLFNRIFSF